MIAKRIFETTSNTAITCSRCRRASDGDAGRDEDRDDQHAQDLVLDERLDERTSAAGRR